MIHDDLPDEGFDDDYAGRDALNGGNDKEIATAASPAVATGPQRYRVRAAEVDALEWTGSNIAAMEAFAGPAFSYYEGEAALLGNPGGAWHPLDVGNYAIKGVTGEFFIIFGEDFADNYEPIEGAAVTREPSDIWQAVLHDNYGNVWTVEDAVESHDSERGFDFALEVSIVRGTAAPVDGRMPGTTDPGDTLCNWDEFDGENDEELTVFRRRWAQAQAMAAGLNAAEATR